jgi:hypothetical protein
MRVRWVGAIAALILTATCVVPCSVHGQTGGATSAIARNVVYGMFGGMALLMAFIVPTGRTDSALWPSSEPRGTLGRDTTTRR